MKNYFTSLKTHLNLKHCVIRMIMAWCFICIIELSYYKIAYGYRFSNLNYVGRIPLGLHIAIILLTFVVIYALLERLSAVYADRRNNPADKIEKILLAAFTVIYAVLCVVQKPDVYFCTGITGLLVFSAAYAMEGLDSSRIIISKGIMRIVILLSGLMFVIFTGGCTVLRYLAYEAPNFDLGLFSQMFHYMKTTLTMNTTLERDGLLSHMCVHVSPVFYLLLPFYAIVPSPATLQVMQAVVIALGIFPLIGICRNHGLSDFEIMLAGIAYFFYPVMSGGCFYDFHENLFLPLFILCLIYYFEKENTKGILISLFLLLSVKEDAAIYAVFICIFMLLEKKSWKQCILTMGVSLAYFVFTTVLLAAIGDGVMSYRYNNMIYGGDGSMLGIVRTVLANPAYILTQMFTADKIEFILQSLGALGFLPLMSKRWTRYVLFGPYVLFCLMSDYTYFHNIFFQYVFGSGTLLLYLAVINSADLGKKIRSRAIPMLAISCVMFFMASVWGRSSVIDRYNNENNQQIYAKFKEAIALIPKEASVTATTFLCPALSDRDIVYELYYTDKVTEYVVLDLRAKTEDYNAETYLYNPEYEAVYYQPGVIGVFHRVD